MHCISKINDYNKPIHLLFASQELAKDSFITHLFPRYIGTDFWSAGSNTLHDAFSLTTSLKNKLTKTSQFIAFKLLKIGDFCLGWALKKPILCIINTVYPVNPLNGERHFVGIPRSLEKKLSDFIIYPFSAYKLSKSNKRLKETAEKIEDFVNKISSQIIQNNGEILNPEGLTQFDYSVQSVDLKTSTAFPGGKAIISTSLVKELDRSVRYHEIQNTCIEFEDGSKAYVDLEGIQLEDVLSFNIASLFSYPASSTWLHQSVGSYIRSCILSLAEPIESFINMFSERKSTYIADVAGSFMSGKSNFNPLGSLYYMQFLEDKKLEGTQRTYKLSELFYQTPSEKNRLRALFVAIAHFAPESLEGRVTWELASHNYDLAHASPAIKSPLTIKKQLEKGL